MLVEKRRRTGNSEGEESDPKENVTNEKLQRSDGGGN
jgi:hypothetical protein